MAGKLNRTQPTRRICLALQGGGSHGAFGWGVLDALLADERIEIEGVSATSAGAMNAAAMAHGLTQGGREGARQSLKRFWEQVSKTSAFSPVQATPFDYAFGDPKHPVFAYTWLDLMSRMVSPYQYNPFNYNPLIDALDECVDFPALRKNCAISLFISATNVRTGKIHVFSGDEISAQSVMASACLPFLFQAVEIDGEAYWDGGYMGNPAIFPLIYNCESRDVVVVHVNPIEREEIPRDAMSIMNRVNEISFNSSLMREMRAIAFATDLIDRDQIRGRHLKRMLLHSIDADDTMRELSVASKLNTKLEFLESLRDVGHATMRDWLAKNFDALGERSTVDVKEKYL